MKSSLTATEILDQLAALQDQQSALKAQLSQEQQALQTLARRLWLQQEQERAKLSRELHDGVGQLLTGLKAQLNYSAEHGASLDNAYQTANEALETVRSLSRLMHPTILDDLGLPATLTWLGRQLLEPHNIELQCQLDLPNNTEHDVQIFLFRVIQEAMVNTAKHSNATVFSISIAAASECLRVDLIDDGCGFGSTTESNGIGLCSMRDRCDAFGASISFNSSPGNGCHISLLLPLLLETNSDV